MKELITAQIREKKTYVEVETSFIPHPHSSQLPPPPCKDNFCLLKMQ